MDILLLFLGLGILLLLGFVSWRLLQIKPEEKNDQDLQREKERILEEKVRLESQLAQKGEELGKLEAELRKTESERSELSGKNKEMWAQNERLQNERDTLKQENAKLEKRVSAFEESLERKEKDFSEKIEKLEHSREKLEKEQARIIREDEAEQQKKLEERDRLWNNHENEVIAKLREVCQKPEIALSCFDNTNLPEHFDGSFKPDFLVSFLDKYLYFDAKVSRSENLQNYLNDQFKKTLLKLKKNPQVYQKIFFVVPSEAISGLKKLSETIEGYTFYVIAPESIEPVLAAYRRITEYEHLEEFDPEEREKIIDVLSKFEHLIRNQNTANILFAEKAFETLSEKEKLSPALQEELQLSLKNLKHIKFKESEVKKLSENIDQQEESIKKLTSPQVVIPKKDLDSAQSLFDEKE